MKMIEEFVMNSTYGDSLLNYEQISKVENEINLFVHQARLERGKDPSFEELNRLRKKVARELREGK